MKEKSSRLVYSTEQGRIKSDKTAPPIASHTDGIVRLRLETKGRKGKGVTTISGLPMDQGALEQLAKRFKQLCATGGSVKNAVIEIQGDHRQTLRIQLESLGHTVKLG